jgi:hypothetical protein
MHSEEMPFYTCATAIFNHLTIFKHFLNKILMHVHLKTMPAVPRVRLNYLHMNLVMEPSISSQRSASVYGASKL